MNDVRVTTVLDVDPQAAFRIFTEHVDGWWGRGPRFRWAPGREGTLRFEPEAAGTRVTLEHRGWDALRPDHPARHGMNDESFANMMAVWWVDLLGACSAHSRARA